MGDHSRIVFQGDEPEYPPEQVEIMSDHHLRDTLGLHDGDVLAFALVTDTQADMTRWARCHARGVRSTRGERGGA
jgi:hypothetical protein